jgi:cell division protein FtsL
MAKRRYRKKARIDRGTIAWMSAFVVILTVITLSGLGRVDAAHDMRGLYGSLGEVQHEQDRLLEQHSRLMLERGALTSMQNIEAVAQSELGMEFPDQVGRVLK